MDTVVTGLGHDWTELTALWAAATPAAADGEAITVQPGDQGLSHAIEVIQAAAAPGGTDRGHPLAAGDTLTVTGAAGRKHYGRAYMGGAEIVATGEGLTGDRGGGGGGGGGVAAGGRGAELILARDHAETTTVGVHAAGATRITVADAADFAAGDTIRLPLETTTVGAIVIGQQILPVADATGFAVGDRIRVGTTPDLYTVESIVGNTITVTSIVRTTADGSTVVAILGQRHEVEGIAGDVLEIAAPGIVAEAPSGADVAYDPMYGADSVIQLPDGPYNEIEVTLLYDLPQVNGNPAFYSGRSRGAYFSSHASWYQTLTNFSYWYAGSNTDPALTSYSVGVLHGTASPGANQWTVEYEVATHRLILLPVVPGRTHSFLPRIYDLVVTGR